MKKLNDDAVAQALSQLQGWTIDQSRLRLDKSFKNFAEVMKYVNLLADLAERRNHHPDFTVHGWNKLTIILFTHDVEGLTEADVALAREIAEIAR